MRDSGTLKSAVTGSWVRTGVALLIPLITVFIGVLPHASKLSDNVAEAHPHWWDALGHLYLSWERFRSLSFQQGFFDFLWYYPYPNTGTYNEPSVTQGLLFGVFSFFVHGEPLGFNLAMVTIVLLNAMALYALIEDTVQDRWISVIFATVGGLSPFVWIRYAHPPNTVMFWGLLGLCFLSRASRRATWANCIAAPAMFVLQVFSSLYIGMFFLVALLLFVPATIAKCVRTKQLGAFMRRAGVASLFLLLPLGFLAKSYSDTRTEFDQINSYEFVSRRLPAYSADYLDIGPVTCHLRALGIREDKRRCWGETFPGLLVLGGTILAFMLAIASAVTGGTLTRLLVLRLMLVATGVVCALALSETWPFHVAVWLNLGLPLGKDTALGVRSPIAVPVTTALLVADITCNPSVEIFGVQFQSIYRLFYLAIPGFDGLRAEYRIVLLLAPMMAVVAAHGVKGLLHLPWLRTRDRLRLVVLVLLTACCVVEGQPRWQDYRPMDRSDRAGAVLRRARALPAGAVMAALKGKGDGIARRTVRDANYFLLFPVAHRHPQITGYSTYDSPAAVAIERAERLRDRDAGLAWSGRLAFLFGGTHLIVDWRTSHTPDREALERMAAVIGGSTRVVSYDSRMALFGLGRFPNVTHGPATGPVPVGEAIHPASMYASTCDTLLQEAYDEDPHSSWTSGENQERGQWVSLRFARPESFNALGFSPGLGVESIPVAYTIEALVGSDWQLLASVEKWTVTEELIERPGTGHIVVSFPKTKTDRIRIRVEARSPWPLRLADVVGYVAPST